MSSVRYPTGARFGSVRPTSTSLRWRIVVQLSGVISRACFDRSVYATTMRLRANSAYQVAYLRNEQLRE